MQKLYPLAFIYVLFAIIVVEIVIFEKNLKVFDMNDQSWSIKLFVWGDLTPFGVFYSNIL